MVVLGPLMIASSELRPLDQEAESAATRLLNEVDLVTPLLTTPLTRRTFTRAPRPTGQMQCHRRIAHPRLTPSAGIRGGQHGRKSDVVP